MKIHKHPITYGLVEIDTHQDAKALHVHEQYDRGCVWLLVDTNAPKVRRVFLVIATGEETLQEATAHYIGTYHLSNATVWHVFDLGESA